MGEAVLFLEVERVQVGAEPDPAGAGAGAECADDAGFGQAPVDLDAKPLEVLGDQLRGPLLLQGGFGMGVKVAAGVKNCRKSG